MYLNDMPLGQRGSFAIFGVAEASRLFFGKDVRNVTLAEAATMAGVLQSPSALSPFNNPERCKERRNVVLQRDGRCRIHRGGAGRGRPRSSRSSSCSARSKPRRPYFVDYVARTLGEDYPGLTTSANQAVDVYTTLDLHLQRLAQDAVRAGLLRVDEQLSRRKRKGLAEAALIAVDPRTGEVLAMVGGRSYNQSQYNRAVTARRQPGSVFKPFVYLSAFESRRRSGRDRHHAGHARGRLADLVGFERRGLVAGELRAGVRRPDHLPARARDVAQPRHHQGGRAGRLRPGRRALEEARRRRTAPKPYPSIALGVFEATPLEIATAYTVFPNMGLVRPLRHIGRVERNAKDVTKKPAAARDVARPDTTYLVTNMMRSVINEGTGAGARAGVHARCRRQDRARPTICATPGSSASRPTLLTVVWVGFDDNQPVGLSGSQAALPIWTQLHERRAGRQPQPAVRGARGPVVGRHRPRHRPARRPRLPARDHAKRSPPAPSRPNSASCIGSNMAGRRAGGSAQDSGEPSCPTRPAPPAPPAPYNAEK